MELVLTVNNENRYIDCSHGGMIDIEVVKEIWGRLLCMPEFTEQNYNLLSDFRGAKFDLLPSKLGLLCHCLIPMKAILSGKRNAVVVNDPMGTAISILFEKNGFFLVKTFSTKEAAFNFLL